ncbi:MAG: hypothetical protein AB3K77_01565 [Methanosarcinaceae archaeon]
MKRKLQGKERDEKTMPEKKMRKVRTKIITIKDTKIESLRIKGPGGRKLLIRNLILKDVRLIIKLPAENE